MHAASQGLPQLFTILMTVYCNRMLHGRFQQLVYAVGGQGNCAIPFTREFAAVDELTHLYLPHLTVWS